VFNWGFLEVDYLAQSVAELAKTELEETLGVVGGA